MAAPGRKAQLDDSPLPWRPRVTGAERFRKFAEKFIKVPKGTGARAPMRLRDWQVDLVGSVFDAEVQPRTAGWLLPRGQGKSTLVAALGLYDLMCGEEGASIVVVAVDERQARIVFGTAQRMVELSPELETRVHVYKDKLVVPSRGASFQVLPASPASLEGLDFTTAIIDEAGVVSRDVYEVVALAGGKRERSTLIAIGTPGPDPDDSVLADLRNYSREHPDDTSQVWREHSADGFQDHPVDCRHCWQLANPALGQFLHEDAIVALLPPKTREATFRRARLGQWVTESTGTFLPHGAWDALADPAHEIKPGADVVIALDGSFNSDSTALVVATVDTAPHFDVVGLWSPPVGRPDWRVPVEEVEDTIRAACKHWNVREVIADPFRWQRSLQILAAEGIRVVEFPWSNSRISAATADFYTALTNGAASHSGDVRLTAHIGATTVREDAKGIRIDKSRRGGKRVDLAAAALMAHSRATWAATRPKKRRRVRSFRS